MSRVHDEDVRRDVEARIDMAQATLTERLAQAERNVAAQRDLNQGLAEGLARMTAERDAALAKAEAAEMDAKEQGDFRLHYHREWLELRARIEALADDLHGEGGEGYVTARLRAILHPPKAETALELVAALEKMALCGPTGNTPKEALAKLRTLLQAASPSP